MLRLLCLSVAGLALSVAGCSTAQAPAAPDTAPQAQTPPDTAGASARVRTPDAGEPFRLAPGEAVMSEGHEVVFIDVVEDSRCPAGAQCVWAGTARIRVSIDGEPVVLSLSPTQGQDTEAQMIEQGDVQVVFVGLEPYPQSTPPQVPAPVRALLITRPSNV